jgi:hypothetical protein
LPIPFAVAEIITEVVEATCVVCTVKVLVVAPAGIVMLETAGAATVELLLERETTILPGAAGHSKVTVPVTSLPPVTGFGLSASENMPMGRTVRAALLVTVPVWAVTVPLWLAETGTVVMVKALEVAPAGTITLEGTVVDASVSLSVTASPLAGAGALIVTVPNTALHPATSVGLRTSDETVGGAAACVTVKIFPATFNVPAREVVAVLAATL